MQDTTLLSPYHEFGRQVHSFFCSQHISEIRMHFQRQEVKITLQICILIG